MFQDKATIEFRHRMFIERIVEFGKVWALENDEGFATSSRNDDNDLEIIPFWSDRAYAKACAKDDWDLYVPTEMTLTSFLEDWLIGMYDDDIWVGTNWNANMFGKEIQPLQLAVEIVTELKLMSKSMDFDKFANLPDYEMQVRNVLAKL